MKTYNVQTLGGTIVAKCMTQKQANAKKEALNAEIGSSYYSAWEEEATEEELEELEAELFDIVVQYMSDDEKYAVECLSASDAKVVFVKQFGQARWDQITNA